MVSERRRRIALDLLVGLILTLLLLGVKLLFERTTPGRLFDGMLYCWVQTQLFVDEHKLPVVVVDISSLDADARPGALTPRAQLEKLIDVIVRQDPVAIGIDVDFSPLEKAWTPRGGPQFFDYVRSLPQPVYLGVHRSRYGGSADWLGVEAYQNLAVNIVVPADDNREMPLWIRRGASEPCIQMAANLLGFRLDTEAHQKAARGGEGTACLPAMSVALAQKYPDREAHPVRWPSSLVRPFHEELIDGQNRVYAGFFFPDYSPARYFLEQTSSAVVSDSDVQLALNPNLAGLKGKIVLLGNTSWEKTPDKYPIPPWQKEVPGVYFHACAVYTLIKGPLLEITGGARLGLDLLLAAIILLVVSWLRLHYSGRTHDEVAAHRVHLVLTSLVILVVLAFGYWLVRFTRILWTDALLVSAALLCHSLLGKQAERGLNWARVSGPGTWRRVVFDKRKEDK